MISKMNGLINLGCSFGFLGTYQNSPFLFRGTPKQVSSLCLQIFAPQRLANPENQCVLHRASLKIWYPKDLYIYMYGGFHKWGYPKMDGLFHGKSKNKMDDSRYPNFRKPLCIYILTCIYKYIVFFRMLPTKSAILGCLGGLSIGTIAPCLAEYSVWPVDVSLVFVVF